MRRRFHAFHSSHTTRVAPTASAPASFIPLLLPPLARRPPLRPRSFRDPGHTAPGAGKPESGTVEVDSGRDPVLVTGSRPEGMGAQNLMLPIIPAMFVVSSLIVGATVDEAR
ncbi:hypothetical protein GCM10010266_15450 [Streptomyces griseomycini]|nr:hypothetical protein GCM10010266_15450 [Streptomyces griseomycini]GGR34291.1 hypothetical protein GCM10015536_45040 [Streptomyces griseomycini]